MKVKLLDFCFYSIINFFSLHTSRSKIFYLICAFV